MTPQSSFMILAPIDPQRVAELRGLLASMNEGPGRVNVNNPFIPFAAFDVLHFARLVILDDPTLDDVRVYGLPPRTYALYLAFLGDLDGDADAFLGQLAERAQDGLRAIFGCCIGFTADADLVDWMGRHGAASAAGYVNWRGRTVRRAREEASLREALESYLQINAVVLADLQPREVRAKLRAFVQHEQAAARLSLTPEDSTPFGWWLRNLLHVVGLPLVLLLASPILIVVVVIVLARLRILEKTDPELCPRVDQAYSDALALIEDHDVSNQFSALGSMKPGVVRLWTVSFVLLIVDYAARHIYTRGRLARVRTIHFARWVWVGGRERLLFMSNYDGSLESYMDDFINKVGFGLNVVFSNGIPQNQLAGSGWMQGRTQIQGIPSPSPAVHAGLVQGLSGTDRGRPRAKWANPARPGVIGDDR